ncbi:MAG: hypothetical protein M1164_00010 [Candidatus Marsarchaeota archaeon]|nr:hypothetical protein [Candidatus Marsarchaeota archaeon]
MAEMLSKLKLGELFQKLKIGLEDLVKESKNMSETNRSIAMSDIGAIRNRIVKKIGRKEDVKENQEILKVLDLFSDDRIFIDVIREESEEWLKFLDSIEKSVKGLDDASATPQEKKEVNDIIKRIESVKGMIRNE